MRKLVSTLLLFLFVWQIIGFVGYFEFSHYKLKKEIKLLLKQGVPEEELIVFTFDKQQLNDLVWLKKNEFDLNGQLFDVVRSFKTKDGKSILKCISDKKEKVLFTYLGEGIASNLADDGNSTPLTNWMKLLHFPLVVENTEIQAPEFSSIQLNDDHFIYHSHFSIKSVRIDSPPPCLLS